jgi:hypothetical protein
MGDKKALEPWVYEQSKLPLEEKNYLIHEKLAKQHSADSADLDPVEELSQRHNLVVVHRSEAERSIVQRGNWATCWALFPRMSRCTIIRLERIAAGRERCRFRGTWTRL